jgi:hypothetical protein
MSRYPRVTDFDQITGDPDVLAGLKSLHRHVDDIEFYTGLFAEDVREHSAVGPMIGRLVGVDAFSQALTNPLLSYNVFNKETFSQVGWEILHETKRLGQILQRNVPTGSPASCVSLTREGGGSRLIGWRERWILVAMVGAVRASGEADQRRPCYARCPVGARRRLLRAVSGAILGTGRGRSRGRRARLRRRRRRTRPWRVCCRW